MLPDGADHEERFEAVLRELLVLEQMFVAASQVRDGPAFPTDETTALFYGIAERHRDIRRELRGLSSPAVETPAARPRRHPPRVHAAPRRQHGHHRR